MFDDQLDAHANRVLDILPESGNKVYDVRQRIECVVDRDSLSELKARFGRAVVIVLARLGGRSVGVIANNPVFKGGPIDVDACRKVVSFMFLCDSFNVPLVVMADQPGFPIGKEGEKLAVTGRVMNWLNAMALVTVPKLALVLRRSFPMSQVPELHSSAGVAEHLMRTWPTTR